MTSYKDLEFFLRGVLGGTVFGLKDLATTTQHLAYKTIGMYTNVKECVETNPAVRGYFLINVWDTQVKISDMEETH